MKWSHPSGRIVLVVLALVLAAVCAENLIAEDCIAFDPDRASVRKAGGRWKITVGSMWLLDFGSSKSEALQALRIIRHYRLDRQCFVGRPDPSLTYYLSSGAAPSGSLAGEDCLPFTPGALEARSVNGRWKIVEGSRWLLDFGSNAGEAREALEIIRRYEFDHICYVGRPQPSMTYLKRAGSTSQTGRCGTTLPVHIQAPGP